MMVLLPSGLTVGLSAQPVKMRQKPDPAKFELAVSLIKKFEGLHERDNFPYYGFGHRLLPGENLSYDMTEAEAEALLRRDLMKRYALFRSYSKDALLLMVLSYNVGTSALLGYGKRPKSRLLRKLEAGDRDIYREYVSYCPLPGTEGQINRKTQKNGIFTAL